MGYYRVGRKWHRIRRRRRGRQHELISGRWRGLQACAERTLLSTQWCNVPSELRCDVDHRRGCSCYLGWYFRSMSPGKRRLKADIFAEQDYLRLDYDFE